jgi:hypothetical protein
MDDIVKQAMAKWPSVPHCYGWLALDARGAWRMRDERAQHLGLPGDKLVQPALVGFINRNYGVDERGCWYFQNGPQRVYLELEAAPYIARTDPRQGLLVQTGAALDRIDGAWLSEDGALIVSSGGIVAQLDDRDLAQALQALEFNGRPMGDEDLMAWIAGAPGEVVLRYKEQRVKVDRIDAAEVPARFGFVLSPAALKQA